MAAKYAWDTDYGDHFETSEQAFRDVAPALRQLCGAGAGAAILDPYYCDGAAETRLRALGFRNATNPATDANPATTTNTETPMILFRYYSEIRNERPDAKLRFTSALRANENALFVHAESLFCRP